MDQDDEYSLDDILTLFVIFNSSFFAINFVLLAFESESNIRILYS